MKPEAIIAYGSSPLARGTPDDPDVAQSYYRFIPARAGNTHRFVLAADCRAVHPRSRGEHHNVPKLGFSHGGSSPLARGTRDQDAARHGAMRFIPARAGNTRVVPVVRLVEPVHPRSRGEH